MAGATVFPSLEIARSIGDTFSGGDVYWDDDRKSVFGAASGETPASIGQIYFDTVATVFAIESTVVGAGTARDMMFRTGSPLADVLALRTDGSVDMGTPASAFNTATVLNVIDTVVASGAMHTRIGITDGVGFVGVDFSSNNSGTPLVNAVTFNQSLFNTLARVICGNCTLTWASNGQLELTSGVLLLPNGGGGGPSFRVPNMFVNSGSANTGIYSAAAGGGGVGGVVSGFSRFEWHATGSEFVVNEDAQDSDSRIEGLTDPNLLYLDASTDRIGIGTSTPGKKLHVVGDVTVTGVIDPTALELSDPAAGTNLYFESRAGQTAAVSPASRGRIRYNGTTNKWQISENTGAYTDFGTAAAGGGWTVTGTQIATTVNTHKVKIGDGPAGADTAEFLNVIKSNEAIASFAIARIGSARPSDNLFSGFIFGVGAGPSAEGYISSNNRSFSILGTTGSILNNSGGNWEFSFGLLSSLASGVPSATTMNYGLSSGIVGGLYGTGATAGISTSATERTLWSGTGVVINDPGNDYDVRMEGDTDPNLFFLDASTDRIGIGTSTPGKKLHVVGDVTVTGVIDPTALELSDPAAGTNLYFESRDGQTAAVSAASRGRIRYNNAMLRWEQSVNGGAYAAFGGVTFPLLAPNGTLAAPSYSFSAETGLGFYRSGATQMSLVSSGTEQVRLWGGGIQVKNGTTSVAAISFLGDIFTGICNSSLFTIVDPAGVGFISGSTEIATIGSGGIRAHSNAAFHATSGGTETGPAYSFGGDDAGFFMHPSTAIGVAVSGSEAVRFGGGPNIQLVGGIGFGATVGTSDVNLSRTVANRLNLDSGDSFDIVSGSLMMGTTVLFEADRDLAVTLLPNADNSLNLGSAARRWANIFTVSTTVGDLHLENPKTGAKWTIEEGLDEVFFTNRRTGKKYKAVLEEVA